LDTKTSLVSTGAALPGLCAGITFSVTGLFSNTSLIFSNYSYNINVMQNLDLVIRSEIKDLNLKQDFSFYANSNNTVNLASNVINHNILPGEVSVNEGLGFIAPENISRRNALEWAAYISNSQRITNKIRLY
jgi:hypothetical protein